METGRTTDLKFEDGRSEGIPRSFSAGSDKSRPGRLHLSRTAVNALDRVRQTARDVTDMENGKDRLQQTQDDVEEVKVIMLDNLNKVDERSGKLGELEDRTDELLAKKQCEVTLANGATWELCDLQTHLQKEKCKTFEKTTYKVKQKKRWENKKMKVVFIGIGVAAGLIVLGLIIFAIVG
ncbi:hypothetical protein FQN60_017533 [Etheostoma spectabile]|uniref:V-SNARE coiled-coil homology domain-containing protein n=1 Tax=Etheostoma spectabile TaxID=54343 RepID=A0A5J5CCR0_9PERO|nr:hypothetical protein FQN60_018661 [Etheostoma spectabile]KAA8592078.1 hypothetical protein FQN60_017533 [Etheostoma spectabile]